MVCPGRESRALFVRAHPEDAMQGTLKFSRLSDTKQLTDEVNEARMAGPRC